MDIALFAIGSAFWETSHKQLQTMADGIKKKEEEYRARLKKAR